MNIEEAVEEFLAAERFAVVGASKDRAKYGNKCLRAYLTRGMDAVPIHPRETEIEGVACHADLASLPEPADAVSVITPPRVTLGVLEEAARLGIRHVWLQPGAEDAAVLARAEELGLPVIAGGPCVLVALARRS